MSKFATIEEVLALLMSWLPRQAKKDARQGHRHPAANLQSLSTGDLTLTASYQDVAGDGPSSDVAVTVSHPGDYLAFAFVDYNGVGAGDIGQNLNTQLLVGSTAQTGIGEARLVDASGDGLRGICVQVWKITVQVGNTIVKIQAKKTGGTGTSIVDGVGADTKLIVASPFGGGGTGGAAATPTAHGSLTGLTDGDDHTQYFELDGSDALTGDLDGGGNDISNFNKIDLSGATGSVTATRTSTTSGPGWLLRYQRSGPLAPLNNKILGQFNFQGYDGVASYASGAAIAALTQENWTDIANGCDLLFYTAPVGGVGTVLRWKILDDGTLEGQSGSNITLASGQTVDGVDVSAHAASGTAHQSNVVAIPFVIDGGGSAITTGQKGHLEIPFAMTISGWTLVADQSGSIVIDVWKDTYANFPPTVADTIAGSEKPTLSSVQKNQDLTLSTWTTAVAAGDILAFNVDSITTVQRVSLILRGTKT